MKRYTNGRGQPAGTLADDGVFRKVVSKEVHLYKNQNAWGIDKAILDDLPPKTEIRIKDEEAVYVTTVERFKLGTEADWGHGVQLLLWRGIFDKIINQQLIPSPYTDDFDASMDLWNSI
jgi:hypothetical protein